MRYRLALVLIVAAFYGGLFALRGLGFAGLYENLLYGLGVLPFVDAHAILSAAECHRSGIAIYPTNPCDILLRPLPYSPVWLDLIPAFMTTAYTPVLGIAFIVAFLAGLFLVLRPGSPHELILMALACTSTCVTFAIERGNADLLLFGFAAATVVLYGRGPTARLGAYALGFAGGMLKFYPFVLVSLALREQAPRFLAVAVTALLGLLAFVAYYHRGIMDALGVMPSGAYFGDGFNAQDLPFGVAELWGGGDGLAWAILSGLVAACVALAIGLGRGFLAERKPLDWSGLEARALVAGSLLLIGCFFAGQNVGYRGIFLLLVLSGLLGLDRAAEAPLRRRLLRLTIAAVLFLLWEEGIRHSFEWSLRAIGVADTIPGIPSTGFWVLRELVWRWVVSVLATMVALFALQCPLAREGVRVFYRSPSHGAADAQALRQRR
ncbi:MAG: hypothetical protein ACREFI_17400 [Stellaceae bacterium]